MKRRLGHLSSRLFSGVKGYASSTSTRSTSGLGALTPASQSVITLLVKACRCIGLLSSRTAVCGIQWVVFTVELLNSWIKCADFCPLWYVTI